MKIIQKKNRSLIIILIAIQIIQISAQCTNFVCQTQNEGNDENCFKISNETQEIKMNPSSCENCQILLSQILQEDGKFNLQSLASYKNCQNKSNSFKKYSGQECLNNDECHSGECKLSENNKNICFGQKEGEQCNESKFCNQGLACSESVCKQAISLDQKCIRTDDCTNDSFCNNQKCVKYGSVQVSEFIEKVEKETIDLRCQSFLIGLDGKCKENSTQVQLSFCPQSKKCKNDSGQEYICSHFSNEKLYYKTGGYPQGVQKHLEQLLQKILTKNKDCPSNIKFSSSCHLIENEIQELQELKQISTNLSVLINMPTCLHDKLQYKELYDKFISETKTIEDKVEQDEEQQNDLDKDKNSESESNSTVYILIAIIVLLIILAVVGGIYFFLRKKKFERLNETHNVSEIKENIPNAKNTKKQKAGGSKQREKSSSQNFQNKEALNLEYNPTSAKGDNQIDISQINSGQDPKKSGHLETSVNQNFFSIDGEDEKNAKIVDQLDQNHSESDISYDNVFNIEGEGVDKPHSQRKRRRQTNRKKIVKNETDKAYDVVEA